jgi:Beta/Gamma crystallin
MAAAILGHIVLYERVNFAGKEKNLYYSADVGTDTDLSTLEDTSFDRQTSSFVIESGAWNFFDDQGLQMGGDFRSGVYSWVQKYGIRNDAIRIVRFVGP